MRILVTGGLGRLGRETCSALAAAGHAVLILDNLHPSSHGKFSHGADHSFRPPRVPDGCEFLRGDVTVPAHLDSAIRACVDSRGSGAEIVVHLARLCGATLPLSERLLTNVVGTACVVEALHRWSVRRLVLTSQEHLGCCDDAGLLVAIAEPKAAPVAAAVAVLSMFSG